MRVHNLFEQKQKLVTSEPVGTYLNYFFSHSIFYSMEFKDFALFYRRLRMSRGIKNYAEYFFVIFHMHNVKWHFFLQYTVTIAPMNCTVHCTQLWLYAAQNCVYCGICPLLSPSVFVIKILSWSHLFCIFVVVFSCVLHNFFCLFSVMEKVLVQLVIVIV